MSTRGAIAWKTDWGWEGVFNRYDSYPSGLGAEIWNAIHGEFGGDVRRYIDSLRERARREGILSVTSVDVDWLWVGWVYVLDPDTNTMQVLASREVADPSRPMGRAWVGVPVATILLDGPEPDWEKMETERMAEEPVV